MSDPYAVNLAEDSTRDNAADRMSRIHGVQELHAAILALMLPNDSKRANRAWEIETVGTPGVEGLREQAASLSGAARLPWFERLVQRMARHPLESRKALLLAARRLMGARGVVRPIDRLHWMVLRRGFGEVNAVSVRLEASVEVTEWLESDVLALGTYTAFLARMVPAESADGSDGATWYAAVMSSWQPDDAELRHHTVDTEEMVHALRQLQSLSWMQRPVVVRSWLQSAQTVARGRLADVSADALRLTCHLLESPLPPELARHYIEIAADHVA